MSWIQATTSIPIRWTTDGECPAIGAPLLVVETTNVGDDYVRLAMPGGDFIIVHRAQLERALAVVREATR